MANPLSRKINLATEVEGTLATQNLPPLSTTISLTNASTNGVSVLSNPGPNTAFPIKSLVAGANTSIVDSGNGYLTISTTGTSGGGGDMLKSVYDPTNAGYVAKSAVTLSCAWSALTGVPSLVLQSTQVSTQYSLTGGGALTGNLMLNLVGDVAIPGNSMFYGTNGTGSRGWYAQSAIAVAWASLTGVPSLVLQSTQVITQYSLTGGGALTGNLTLNLVGDVSAPGNSMVYGTSSSGARGWYAVSGLPVAWASITGAPAFVLQTRNISTQYSLTGGGPLSANLTLNLVGDVAAPGNNQLYGTNGSGARGWQAVSGLSIAWSQLTGVPSVVTSGSITGGGALTASLTIQLSGDNATPGNSMLYGTNGSGVKGWYAQGGAGWTSLTGKPTGTVVGSVLGTDTTSIFIPWFKYHPDADPASATSFDDDFEGSTINAKWTVSTSGASAGTVASLGNSVCSLTNNTAGNDALIYQSLGSITAPWAFTCKIEGPGGLFSGGDGNESTVKWGLWLGTPGSYLHSWHVETTYEWVAQGTVAQLPYQTVAVWTSTSQLTGSLSYVPTPPKYFRVYYDGTFMNAYVSWDGLTWVLLAQQIYTSSTFSANAPTAVGILVRISDNQVIPFVSCDWFRRTT